MKILPRLAENKNQACIHHACGIPIAVEVYLCKVGKLTAPGSKQECRGCCGRA